MTAKRLSPEQEAQLHKYLSKAHVESVRGNWAEAEVACLAALEHASDDAQVHEMLADILRERGNYDRALEEYKVAQTLDPKRASAETKYAELVLAVAEKERAKFLAQDMLDNPHLYVARTRKPMAAMFLGMLLPGLGQVYNGQLAKAGIIFGTFVLWVIAMALFQHYPPTISSIGDLIQYTDARVELLGFIAVTAYVYGIIDAASAADKSSKADAEHLLK